VGERAAWQRRLDRAVVVAALVALPTAVLHIAGVKFAGAEAVLWVVWATFLADAVGGMAIAEDPVAWARGHRLELFVLVVAFPLWPHLAPDYYYLELAPALEIGKVVAGAKILKAVLALRRKRAV
jgi:hypothetical protein